jgi:ribokinase
VSRSGRVVVLGSANSDLVLNVPRLPVPGETLLATDTARMPGGKGANQAVAAVRAGAATTLLAAFGDDADGDTLRSVLAHAGVGLDFVRVCPQPTGLAVVIVDGTGQNSIVVSPGANATITSLNADEVAAVRDADVLLCQLEVPMSGVAEALIAARSAGVRVIVNAAPSRVLPPELWSAIDVLVVNEHEAADLAGLGGSLEATIGALLDRVPAVIVTVGSEGARLATRDGALQVVPAPTVVVVDTTGAGDTFCGVLAAALAAGSSLSDAVPRAVDAASVSVQRSGAIASVPIVDEID